MIIRHRITLKIGPSEREVLAQMGVEIEEGFNSFFADEGTPLWEQLAPHLKEWQVPTLPQLMFDKSEFESAEYHQLISTHQWGYPQPENDWGYRVASFNLDNFCPICNVGAVQNAPIRMVSEPKWGRQHIMAMNWLTSMFFARPEVWESVFKPLGIMNMPVLHHKSGKELKTVVQLLPQGIAEGWMNPTEVDSKFCSTCERPVYSLKNWLTFRPALKEPSAMDYFLSREEMEANVLAWRMTLVSARFYRVVRDNKLNGVGFIPLAQETAAQSPT